MEEPTEFPIYPSREEAVEALPKIYVDRRAALVQDAAVVNMIIVAEDEDGSVEFQLAGHEIIIVPDDSEVNIGWTYVDGEFIAPPPPPELEELPLSE